jgi:hypothetical protein
MAAVAGAPGAGVPLQHPELDIISNKNRNPHPHPHTRGNRGLSLIFGFGSLALSAGTWDLRRPVRPCGSADIAHKIKYMACCALNEAP